MYDGNKFDFLKPNGKVAIDNQWIGFLASYSGSIIGGIIGGAMTLIGVLLTFKNKNKDELIATYPNKRRKIKELRILIGNLDELVNADYYVNVKEINDYQKFICSLTNEVLKFENENNLSSIAGEIDGYILMVILDFIELNEDIQKEATSLQMNEEIFSNILLELKLRWTYTKNTIQAESNLILAKMERLILK